MIHKFEQGGLFMVVDVNSGAVHVVDELVYDILDHYPAKEAGDIVGILEEKYDAKLITDALGEIDELMRAEQIFCEDKYIHNLEFKARKPVIKAMCLHVAHDCNIRCKYCFASQGDFEGDRSLCLLKQVRRLLNSLRRTLETEET